MEIKRTISTNKTGRWFEIMLSSLSQRILSEEWSLALKICDECLDIIWEKLNTGYWKDVDMVWRHAYTYITTASVYVQYQKANCDEVTFFPYRDLIKKCDMGLLMGAPSADNILSQVAAYFKDALLKLQTSTENPDSTLNSYTAFDRIQKPDMKLENPIETLSLPSIDAFRLKFYDSHTPCKIRDSMNHWPAMSTRRWTLSYINHIAGCRTVPVEVGMKYTDENWTEKLMLLSDFVTDYLIKGAETQGYLAQHQLFNQIPELEQDICVPTYCCLSELTEDVDINAWFGPKHTVSPLHYDPKHNFLCQVVGYKYVKLFSQSQTDCLYPHEGAMLENTSQVDLENPDLEKFPKYSKAKFEECILAPGEMLYIPPKYWHFVKSLSPSFSVSFWF